MLGLLWVQEEAFAASVSSALHNSTFLGECTTRAGGPHVCRCNALNLRAYVTMQAPSGGVQARAQHCSCIKICMKLPSNRCRQAATWVKVSCKVPAGSRSAVPCLQAGRASSD